MAITLTVQQVSLSHNKTSFIVVLVWDKDTCWTLNVMKASHLIFASSMCKLGFVVHFKCSVFAKIECLGFPSVFTSSKQTF